MLKCSFYRLFFSVSTVLLIPLTVILLSFSFSLRDTVLADYLTLNNQIVNNIGRTVDTAITSQTSYAYSMRDSRLLRQMSANLMEDRIEMQEACLELSHYMSAILFNNISSMTAVYFPGLDLVVSSHAHNISMKDFYDRYVRYDNLSADEFKEPILTIDQYKYWPSAHCTPTSGSYRSMIIYAQPVNMGYLMPRAYYITFIDERTLVNLVRNSFENEVSFQLFDHTGRELIRTSGVREEWAEIALTAPERYSLRTEHDGSFRLFRTQQLSDGLCFVFYVPESAVTLRISHYIILCLIAIGAGLLIGLLIANRFARRLHTPYEKLLNTAFPNENCIDGGSMKEGLGIIEARIKEEQQLNKRFREELQSYYRTEREKTLLSLMARSSYLSREEIQEAAEICGLPLHHAAYQVALLKTSEEGVNHSPLASINDTSDMIYVIQLSRYQFLVLTAFSDQTQNPLPSMLEPLQSLFLIGCSQIHSSLYDLSLCIDEADAALRSKINSDDQGEDRERCYYPFDQELQLIASVRNGQYTEVSRLIYEIRRYNRESAPDALALLDQAMLSTALKLAEEFTPEQKALLESSVHAVTKDCHVDGGNDMAFAELLNLYRQLCGFMSSNIHNKNLSIIDNVCDYLNEHYTDPNLCLDSVAEHFTVSYYFLSHIFKSETNKSFSDMLNDTRIYHAMELLKATSLPVQTIAKQVGYTNWSTFLRAFRKRADLTPVQYRHAHS